MFVPLEQFEVIKIYGWSYTTVQHRRES